MSRIRLICPNCAAQYEVPLDVIPTGGRDVQCSNCGHTWFQNHPDDDTELAEELNQPVPDQAWAPEEDDADDDDDGWVEPERPAAPPPQAPTVAPRQPEEYEPPAEAPAPERTDPRPTAEADQPPPPPPPAVDPGIQEQARSRGLDPEVAEVLREEREHERRQRMAESGAFESQPDLGLTDPDEDEQARRAREARERMAIMRGADGAPPPEARPVQSGRDAALAAAAAGSRRELLPDVEEINQTLRSTGQARVVDQAERREQPDDTAEGGGFSRAFLIIVLLVAIAIAVYAFADQISAAVPALAPVLEAYVAQVDALRLWIDGQVKSLLMMLDGMSSEAAPDAAPAEAPAPAETPEPAEPAPADTDS